MPRRNGVDQALRALSDGKPLTAETRGAAAKKLAEMLDGISVPAIYKFRRQGYFPLDRAKVVAAQLEIPLADLVRDDVREALLSNNS